MPERKLPRGRIIRYFTADIAKGLFNGMIGNYLLYFYQPTTVSGLPQLLPNVTLLNFITVMALITAISKIVDAVTDPIVAHLSDRCSSKYGRRVPFMRVAAVPYALCVLMIFFAPFKDGSAWNAVWVAFFIIAYYVFYTIYFIPHRALVPEIIPDSKERVGYYAISTVFFMGSSAVMYATTMFVSWFKQLGLSSLWAWRCVFIIFAAVGMTCLLIGAFAFKENDYVVTKHRPDSSFFKSFGEVFKNKNYVMFTLGDLFSYISMAFFQSAMLYYITVLINVPEAQSFYIMLAAIATAICCFPLLVYISRKRNKKTPLVVASWMFAVLFVFIYFGNDLAKLVPGREIAIGIVMGLLVAYPFAAINVLPQAVLSDIIQADSIQSGINREGIYSATKTFIEKIASAVAMLIVSSVLAIGAAEGTSVGLEGVKLTGVFAAVFSLVSAVFFMLYNDKKVMRIIKDGTSGGSTGEVTMDNDSMCQSQGAQSDEQSVANEEETFVMDARCENYVEKLTKMLRCRTIYSEGESAEFDEFYDTLKDNFPNLYSKGECLNLDGCLVYKVAGSGDKNILLMSHHDVVAAGDNWQYPPFEAELHGGKIYARGAIDTKTPLFAELQALEQLLEEGVEFAPNVYVASSNNEEVSGEGIFHALEYFKQNGIHFEFILDEGGAIVEKMLPGVQQQCAMIAVHEKGRHAYTCTAKKDTAKDGGHAGLTCKTDNPIVRMSKFIDEIERTKWTTKLYPEVKQTFLSAAPYMPFGLRMIFKNINLLQKPLIKIMPKISPQVGAMLGTTVSFTQINSSSTNSNIQSKEVTATAFFRCVREEDLQRDVQKFTAIADKYGITVQQTLADFCPPTDFDGEAYKYVKSTVSKVFPDVVVAPFLLTAGTDARRLYEVSDNILRFAPIALSSEQFATVHSDNENIDAESVTKAVDFYVELITNAK